MFVNISAKARLDHVGDRLIKARARSLTILLARQSSFQFVAKFNNK